MGNVLDLSHICLLLSGTGTRLEGTDCIEAGFGFRQQPASQVWSGWAGSRDGTEPDTEAENYLEMLGLAWLEGDCVFLTSCLCPHPNLVLAFGSSLT